MGCCSRFVVVLRCSTNVCASLSSSENLFGFSAQPNLCLLAAMIAFNVQVNNSIFCVEK